MEAGLSAARQLYSQSIELRNGGDTEQATQIAWKGIDAALQSDTAFDNDILHMVLSFRMVLIACGIPESDVKSGLTEKLNEYRSTRRFLP